VTLRSRGSTIARCESQARRAGVASARAMSFRPRADRFFAASSSQNRAIRKSSETSVARPKTTTTQMPDAHCDLTRCLPAKIRGDVMRLIGENIMPEVTLPACSSLHAGRQKRELGVVVGLPPSITRVPASRDIRGNSSAVRKLRPEMA